MEYTYSISKTEFGDEIITRDNGDGSATHFMADPANSDYQAYLKSLDEAATL
jgi:hypothetical protein